MKEAHKLYEVPDFQKKVPSEAREETLRYIKTQLFTRDDGDLVAHGPRATKRIFKCYLILCYIGVKLLYFLNCLLQIGLIHLMIGTRPFGISRFNHLKQDTLETHFLSQFSKKMRSGISELIDTSSFPKRTLCDFTFRELASNHAYTVECILPLNIIVEKMYVFLYVWFIILALITLVDFIKWIGDLVRFLVRTDRAHEHYVKTHLIDRAQYNPADIKRFSRENLTGNNYFLLKLLSKNISSFVVVDVLDYFFRTKTSNKKSN